MSAREPGACAPSSPRRNQQRHQKTNFQCIDSATIRCICACILSHIQTADQGNCIPDSKYALFDDINSPPSAPVTLSAIQHIFTILHTHSQMEYECMIIVLIYIERLSKYSNHTFLISHQNWKSILCITMLLASKVWDDFSMSNSDFHYILHTYIDTNPPLPLSVFNSLEWMLLENLQFHVHVTRQEYNGYSDKLRDLIAAAGSTRTCPESDADIRTCPESDADIRTCPESETDIRTCPESDDDIRMCPETGTDTRTDRQTTPLQQHSPPPPTSDPSNPKTQKRPPRWTLPHPTRKPSSLQRVFRYYSTKIPGRKGGGRRGQLLRSQSSSSGYSSDTPAHTTTQHNPTNDPSDRNEIDRSGNGTDSLQTSPGPAISPPSPQKSLWGRVRYSIRNVGLSAAKIHSLHEE